MLPEKYVLIYGAGISGCGVAEVLSKKGRRVMLFNDEQKPLDPQLSVLLEASGGRYVCGEKPDAALAQADTVVVSPGIPMQSELVTKAIALGIEVMGEVEVAARLFDGRMIAITGTNGKTTTTTLVGEMMKFLPCKTAVGGNIGQTLSKELQGLGKNDWLVAELSSFQLEGVRTLKPAIAAVLNITPDHLDRHGNMTEYIRAKSRIFARQTSEDYLILNFDDKIVAAFAKAAKARVCFLSRTQELKEGAFLSEGSFVMVWNGQRQVICAAREMRIFGSHNVENALAAIACASLAGVPMEKIREVLTTFQGVEHRLEYVTEINGVPYYNDSKATNPDSTIKALQSFTGGIILLAGGRDKNTDLGEMMALAKTKVDALILLGEAKERFRAAAAEAGINAIYAAGTFDEAVSLALRLAKPSQVVLLSPACASYDMFDNFPHRGRYFKELVNKYKNQPAGRIF